jgi:hypothetical protein
MTQKFSSIAAASAIALGTVLLSSSALAQSGSRYGGMTTQAPDSSAPTADQQHATQSLSTLRNARQQLASAKVEDLSGRPIGQVQSVDTAKSGAPTSVQVALNPETDGGKLVAIPANDLTYDRNDNTVVAQVPTSQIEDMSGTKDKSKGPYDRNAPSSTPPSGY